MGKLDLTYVLPYLSWQDLRKKSFEKVGGTWIFWLGRKNGRNHGSARLGLKMVKTQKLFFPQVLATLWPTDG